MIQQTDQIDPFIQMRCDCGHWWWHPRVYIIANRGTATCPVCKSKEVVVDVSRGATLTILDVQVLCAYITELEETHGEC